MARGESPAVFRDIHTLFHAGTSNGLTDGQLLDRFRARADLNSSEAAFAGLMARHGPMVLGVCRRALSNPDDVADAFQATFLILARKADSVRVEDSLGRWLYGVSRRVSVRAKLAAARRSAREVGGVECVADRHSDNSELGELRELLDEEIGRLPEKFRSAVVLCDLEGLGHDEAARQLGCAAGTVKSRLSRAREKLRSRLIRRGVAPVAALARGVESTTAAVPATLMDSTVKTAIGSAGAAISPAVSLLIHGVLRAMLLNKLRMVAIAVVSSLALATTAGVLARQAASASSSGDPGGPQAVKKVTVDKDAGSADLSSKPTPEVPATPVEDFDDRFEALRFDIQLLTQELQARQQEIDSTHADLVQAQLAEGNTENFTNVTPRLQPGGEVNFRVLSKIDPLKAKLERSRKGYFAKKKELRQKQSELDQLRDKRNSSEKGKLAQVRQLRVAQQGRVKGGGAPPENAVSGQPPTSRAPAISPVLETRLSEIEKKLDLVLKALADLKRDNH
jgi:RNA polymerase sigma factor (sigma-70 family)